MEGEDRLQNNGAGEGGSLQRHHFAFVAQVWSKQDDRIEEGLGVYGGNRLGRLHYRMRMSMISFSFALLTARLKSRQHSKSYLGSWDSRNRGIADGIQELADKKKTRNLLLNTESHSSDRHLTEILKAFRRKRNV